MSASSSFFKPEAKPGKSVAAKGNIWNGIDLDAENALEGIQLKLKKGADLNSYDENKATLLSKVVFCENEAQAIKLARWAVDNGADLSKRIINSEFKNTPLLLAMAEGKKLLSEELINLAFEKKSPALYLSDQEKNSKNTPLILAIKQGWVDTALCLIAMSPDSVTQSAADNFSALHYACMLRQDPVIQKLIQKGTDLNQLNRFGAKPIDYYVMGIQPEDFAADYKWQEHLKTYSMISAPARIPDFHHVVYFEGLKKREGAISKELLEKLGKPSEEFERRINKRRREMLKKDIEMIIKHGAPRDNYYQDIQNKFDSLYASLLSSAYVTDVGSQRVIEEDARKAAITRFIDEYLAEQSCKALDLAESKKTLNP